MRKVLFLIWLWPIVFWGQQNKKFKKRVLQSAEIEILSSYYTQQGNNASVTGGIGNEYLDDFATSVNIAIPISADDVLTIDATISTYTSASSSNLNPFTGASRDDDDDDEDDDDRIFARNNTQKITGSPWVASTGESKSDDWYNGVISYSHSSDNRNSIFSANISVSNEFDYFSMGSGLSFTKLFNNKNTEISIGVNAFWDHWRPEYPTEIKTYIETNGNLNQEFFKDVNIYNQNGQIINKFDNNAWKPQTDWLIRNKARNTYTASLSFSQILNENIQMSLFTDITLQTGQLANPMQRVYFKDKPNFYIGNPLHIPYYTTPKNTEVFQLADAYEQLPDKRLKFPIGIRMHYFLTHYLVLRTYYRYYFDSWDLHAHTFNLELPVKLNDRFTVIPDFRYYTQNQIKYFAPYEEHFSTQKFYTSDYDLAAYKSYQAGLGIRYSDALLQMNWWKFNIKNIYLNYYHYRRTTGLKAHITNLGVTIILE